MAEFSGAPRLRSLFKGTGWGPTRARSAALGANNRRRIPDAGAGMTYNSAFGPDGSSPPVHRRGNNTGGGVQPRSSNPLRQSRTGFPPGPSADVNPTADPREPRTELLKRFVRRGSRNAH